MICTHANQSASGQVAAAAASIQCHSLPFKFNFQLPVVTPYAEHISLWCQHWLLKLM
jgi:hypothetical protein